MRGEIINHLTQWTWWLISIYKTHNNLVPSYNFHALNITADGNVLFFLLVCVNDKSNDSNESVQPCIACIIILNHILFLFCLHLRFAVVKHTHYPVRQVVKVPEHIPAPYPVEKTVSVGLERFFVENNKYSN